MAQDKKNFLVLALVIGIVVLLGVLAFIFLVNPALNGLVVQGQTQGYNYAILTIAQQVATCKPVPLTIGNQTINLIAVECLQQTAK
ncbi:Uncharacterised protein [uncultured archaeon]|nr:Uncharacterised protein [uncultured archaeon]